MKKFVCFGVSSNTNSFGLWGHRMMSEDGEYWEIALNDINKLYRGQTVQVALDGHGQPNWGNLGAEIPHFHGIAPPNVIAECWKLPV